jgi:hypothetical protein
MNEAFSKCVKLPAVMPRLLERKILLSYFTAIVHNKVVEMVTAQPDGNWKVDPTALQTLMSQTPITVGDVIKVVSNHRSYLTIYGGDDVLWNIKEDDDGPLFDIYDQIVLKEGDIANFKGAETTTTIGRFVLNYIVGASVFGDKIPYINTVWNIGKTEDLIAAGLLAGTITMVEYRKYIDHGYFIGHLAEISVPTITERSFTTDPKIKARKKELFEEHKDQLSDPLVLDKIENELLKMDREYLKGDDSLGFHLAVNPTKSLAIHRKKLFLTVGAIEDFTSGATSGYVNIPNSLAEGWNKNNFDAIANEIRKGSYSRGILTALGGAMAKTLLRIFQDVKVVMDDCKTTKGIRINLSKEELGRYQGRFVIGPSGLTPINSETAAAYTDKDVYIRSPLYCKAEGGLCYACIGSKIKSLGLNFIGAQAVDIGSTFQGLQMKNMHGSKISTVRLQPMTYIRTVDKKKSVLRISDDTEAEESTGT